VFDHDANFPNHDANFPTHDANFPNHDYPATTKHSSGFVWYVCWVVVR
jgi:hypothetical protein